MQEHASRVVIETRPSGTPERGRGAGSDEMKKVARGEMRTRRVALREERLDDLALCGLQAVVDGGLRNTEDRR